MTHDELMKEIDRYLVPTLAESEVGNKAIGILKALRAVVELHYPWEYAFPSGGKISYCRGCPEDMENGQPEWPCDTIQVIEKELL